VQIDLKTTLQKILDAHPLAVASFAERGLHAEFLSDPSMLGTELAICERLDNNSDVQSLMKDLRAYIEANEAR